jgi:hypothetical protein
MSAGMSIVAPGAYCRIACLVLVMLLGACKSIDGTDQVIDPLGPNWHVEQYDLGNGRYAIAMTKKRLTTGGDGESPQIFRRRVDQIQREQGFAAYEVIEFSEGIESNLPIAQRVSRGIVQFSR